MTGEIDKTPTDAEVDGRSDPGAGASVGGRARKPGWANLKIRNWAPLKEHLGTATAQVGSDDSELTRLYRQAYDSGIQRAKSTVQVIMQRYHHAIAQLGFTRQEIMAESERDLVRLALYIAELAIGSDKAARRRFTVAMVDHALQLLSGGDKITLRVGSTDLHAIHEEFPELLANPTVRLIEDPSINLGGVIAECELGRVDATLRQRLAEIAEQIDNKPPTFVGPEGGDDDGEGERMPELP